jgi:hypothetical protein
MKAAEAALRVLLEGQTQFVIALFQRPYSWDRAKWETLWFDILETYEADRSSQHFLGSIVSKSLPGTPEGVSPYLVIDGQQRLATLTIILAALRDEYRKELPDLAEKIDNLYLKNRFVSASSSYKVLPTQADRPSYFAIINGEGEDDRQSNNWKAYRYFRQRLSATKGGSSPLDARKLEQTILSGLSLVSITLGAEDNEYRIFESLNAKGMPLKQVDLIRNYVLMRVQLEQQDAVYSKSWRPLELRLGEHLEDFFRYEYMSSGDFVRESDVYFQWKRRLDKLSDGGVIEALNDLGERARYYERMVNPDTEPDLAVRVGFRRLNRWGAQTMYPFLLFAYGEYNAGALDGSGFSSLLRVVESFLVRRLFAGVPTNALNRLFLRLGQQQPEGMNLLEGTTTVLSEPSRRWPTDDEFRQSIQRYPLYTDSRPDQRRLILETFEKSFGHKEEPDLAGLTIEHVMPQSITDAWRERLGPEASRVHAKLLHVLGNLTLTGYNPELSNSSWAEKRVLLRESHLEMNKQIANHDEWREAEITQRGSDMAELAVNLWAGPLAGVADAIEIDGGSDRPTRWANFYQACQKRLEEAVKLKLTRTTATILASGDGTCVVVCLISREYNGNGYWWAFSSRHEQALKETANSYLALGCGSADQLLLIPFANWAIYLDSLNVVARDGHPRWFIHIRREGKHFNLHRKGGMHDLDVTQYLIH